LHTLFQLLETVEEKADFVRRATYVAGRDQPDKLPFPARSMLGGAGVVPLKWCALAEQPT
jgi:hypothetical protein